MRLASLGLRLSSRPSAAVHSGRPAGTRDKNRPTAGTRTEAQARAVGRTPRVSRLRRPAPSALCRVCPGDPEFGEFGACVWVTYCKWSPKPRYRQTERNNFEDIGRHLSAKAPKHRLPLPYSRPAETSQPHALLRCQEGYGAMHVGAQIGLPHCTPLAPQVHKGLASCQKNSEFRF